MISHKRKYLYALVTFIVAAAIAGSGAPVKIFLGFPEIADILYIISLMLIFIGGYHLIGGLRISHANRNNISRNQNDLMIEFDREKRRAAKKSFALAVVVYLISWFVLTGASSAKLASASQKDPVLIYIFGLIGVLIAFYLSFRGARLYYLPPADQD